MKPAECYIQLDLKTPAGVKPGDVMLSFASLEAACCDVYLDIPNAAAAALREGVDPMTCSYLLRSDDGSLLMEIPFADLVRGNPPVPSTEVDLDKWQEANARLKQRSDNALRRFDRASAWMNQLAAQALRVSQRAENVRETALGSGPVDGRASL